MQARHELFSDAIGPAVVCKKLLGVVSLHGLQQVLHWIRANRFEQNRLLDVGDRDRQALRSLPFHEVGNLIVLLHDVHPIEIRRLHIADFEFLFLLKAAPDEKALLVGIIEEIVDVMVVLVRPVFLFLKCLDDLGTVLDEESHSYN